MKYTTQIFRLLLLLISLMTLAGLASAQSSLVFRDSAGRKAVFTNFGTIVYPDRNNAVSRGYEVVYRDGTILKRAWYLNSSINSGIMPVSLAADRPNGHTLRAGETVYVRARMKTADDKLTITCRYIWREGAQEIDAIVTIGNSSNSSIDLEEYSLTTPTASLCQCPCDPVKEFDGATVRTSIITIAPNQRYRKSTAVFAAPPLQRGDSKDVEGCEREPHTTVQDFN